MLTNVVRMTVLLLNTKPGTNPSKVTKTKKYPKKNWIMSAGAFHWKSRTENTGQLSTRAVKFLPERLTL